MAFPVMAAILAATAIAKSVSDNQKEKADRKTLAWEKAMNPYTHMNPSTQIRHADNFGTIGNLALAGYGMDQQVEMQDAYKNYLNRGGEGGALNRTVNPAMAQAVGPVQDYRSEKEVDPVTGLPVIKANPWRV